VDRSRRYCQHRNSAAAAKNVTLAGAEPCQGRSCIGKLDSELASHSQTYAGTGTVRWTWKAYCIASVINLLVC
jgi:hypothetical protein